MLDGRELASRFPAELLGRPELSPPTAVAARSLAGRRILVTGAGGSVGQPLAAALASAEPEALLLVDHHEASLWDLHLELGDRPMVQLLPADIRDGERLARTFERFRPEIVFHLAAYK